MSTIDRTARGQGNTVEFEFDLRHEPAKVWRALTDPGLLEQWLLPSVGLRLERGTAFQFRRPPLEGWDGIVNCRIVEVDEPRSLSYSWVVGDIDTVVSFTLTQTITGTLLRMVQSGFRPDQKQNFGGARFGWKMMGEKLEHVMETI